MVRAITRNLDLAPVRQRLGEHWPRYEDAVHRITGRVIEEAVGPSDAWSRSGDVFIISFGEGPEARIEAVYARVEQRLSELLFGTGLDSQLAEGRRRSGARGHRRRRKKRGFLQLFGRLFIPFRGLRISRRRKGARSSEPPLDAQADPIESGAPATVEVPAAEPISSASVSARSPPGMHPARASTATGVARARSTAASRPSRMKNSELPAPSDLPASVVPDVSADRPNSSALSSATRPIPPDNGGGMPIRIAKRDAKEIRQIERAIADATMRVGKTHIRDAEALEAIMRQIRFGYRPTWNTRTNLLSIYRCVSIIQDGGGFREGEAVLPPLASDEAKALLDQLALPNVTFDVEALIREERKVLVAVPVHFASFVNEWSAKQLINLCHHIPEAGRQRIIFEIVDAVEGRADPRLRDAVRALKPYCLRLGARLPLLRQDLRFWREMGFTTLGVDLSDANVPESELITELDRFYLAARQEGLATLAQGLNTRSLILAAATMGIHFVNGAPISSVAATGDLDGMPFALADLYSDILPREAERDVWRV